jgi:hypothetical protein
MGQLVTLQLPFAGGLDQKTSAHYLDPNARLATIVNGNFTKINVIDKRLGIGLTATLPAGTYAPAVARLASWSKGDVDVLSQNGLYAVEAASGASVNVGPLPPAQTVRRPIPLSANAINLLPVVGDLPTSTTTLRVVVYTGPGTTVYALVYDINTQQIVCPATQIYANGAGNSLALVTNVLYLPNAPANEQLAIFFADTSQSGTSNVGLFACNYVAATNSFTAPVNLAQAFTNGNTMPVWDVAPFTGDPSGNYLLTYAPSSGGYIVYVVSPAHVLGANVSVTAPGGYVTGGGTVPGNSNQVYVCGQSGTSDLIWLVYTCETANSTMRLYVASWGQPSSFPVNLAPTMVESAPSLWVIPPVQYSPAQAAFGYQLAVSNAITTTFGGGNFLQARSSGVTGIFQLPLGFFPIARPWVQGGIQASLTSNATFYLPAVLILGATSLQGTQYLLQGSVGTGQSYGLLPVATSAPRQVDLQSIQNGFFGLVGAVVQGPNHVPFGSVSNPSSYTAVPIRVAGEDVQSATLTPATTGNPGLSLSTWQTTYNFASPLQYQASELGGLLHVQGGCPFLYDGATVFEDNFFYYPEFTNVSTAGTGTTLPSGTYTYAVVYVYADSAGLVHRSAPYFTNTITITNGGAYPSLSIPELTTWRPTSQVFAEIYRTTASPASPTFYLLDRCIVNIGTALGFTTYNDNNANNGNASLQTSTILYTTGGVLDRVNRPSCNGQALHKSRVWGIDDTLQAIWFTQQFTPGEAPGYNDGALVLSLSDGGDILALQSMDTELLIFKKNSIWYMYGGDGPNSEGTGPDETTPAPVPGCQVGIQDWRSVVMTSAGAIFASSSGFYLLDRSLGLSFIGSKVVDLFAQYPTCVGVAFVPGSTQVRFAMVNNGFPATSAVLVYDYFLEQWTQHIYAQQSAALASLAVSTSGIYSVLTTDGCVWQEQTNGFALWLDENTSSVGAFVPTTLKTAEIKVLGPGALQAYQRLLVAQLYADRLDPAQITIGLAVNGNPTVVASRTWTYQQLQALTYNQIFMSMPAALTRCMSVQLTLSDSADPSTATGQGARWSGLALQLEAVKDRYPQSGSGNR